MEATLESIKGAMVFALTESFSMGMICLLWERNATALECREDINSPAYV